MLSLNTQEDSMKNFIGLKSFFERNFYKGILIDARELEKRGIFNAWKLNFFDSRGMFI